MTIDDHRLPARPAHDRQRTRCSAPCTSDNFTVFEGTSEIQRLIIDLVVTGLALAAGSQQRLRMAFTDSWPQTL
jgi:hypothetical protein